MWYFLVFFILFYQFVLSTAGVEFKFSWIHNIQRDIKKSYIITILLQIWNTTLFQKRVMRTKFYIYVFIKEHMN